MCNSGSQDKQDLCLYEANKPRETDIKLKFTQRVIFVIVMSATGRVGCYGKQVKEDPNLGKASWGSDIEAEF